MARCCACGACTCLSKRKKVVWETSTSGAPFCDACRGLVLAVEKRLRHERSLFLCSSILPDAVVWAHNATAEFFQPWRLPPAPAAPAVEIDCDGAAGLVAACDALVVYAGRGLSVAAGLTTAPSPAPEHWGDDAWECYLPVFAAAEQLGADPAPVTAALLQLVGGRRRSFVVTSNVDGLLERCGGLGGRLLEVHGSTLRLQCSSARTHDTRQGTVPTPPGWAERFGRRTEEDPACRRGHSLRFNISTAGDELDDLDCTVREAQVAALRAFAAVGARRVCHLLVGVGAGNPDSLFPEVRVVQSLFPQTMCELAGGAAVEHSMLSVGPEEGAPGSRWLRAGAEEALPQLVRRLQRTATAAAPAPAPPHGGD